MFLAFISSRLIIFSPNYPLKFRLPEFSPGGYYSGKFHQNPCSVCEFSEPGGRWEESGACLHLCFGGRHFQFPEMLLAAEPAGPGAGEGEAGQRFSFIPRKPLVVASPEAI